MPKTKVLFIHQDGLVTGSAISLRHFLSAINRDEFEPIVLLAEEGAARKLYEDLGIKVIVRLFKRFWTFPGPNWFSRANFKQLKALLPDKQLANFIISLKPDIIHINDKASINVGISMKGSGIPIVQHSRSSYCITASKINKGLSASSISMYAKAIIAISEDEIDGHENFENLHIINNTVPPAEVEQAIAQKSQKRKELGISEDEIVVGMVAAISYKKGAWRFMEMAAELVKKYPTTPLKFLMVGSVSDTGNTMLDDGKFLPQSPKQYIDTFIEKNNLQGKLIVTGFRNDALAVMAGLDVLVVANSNGVMGRQPIEAQALGIPTVVTQGHSGKSTILLNNQSGYVISNPINQVDLFKSVEELINNPEKRAEFGHNGKQYAAQKFSPAINMGKIETIYKEILPKN